MEEFSKRFLKECVSLYNYDYSKEQNPVEFKKGDIVWLLRSKSPEHGSWPRAKVTDLIVGADGKVRTIYVQNGDKIEKTAIKDVALLLSEPETTTVTTDSGVVLIPQFPPRPELYKTDKAGISHLW
jgi:hypothetical protein